MNSLDKIKHLLLRQEQQVEADLKSLEKDDPLLQEALAESSEPGTDSWLADTHSRAVAAKTNLQNILKNIRKSLLHLDKGDYGKCEKCGRFIEDERLNLVPTTTLCISCSKKSVKK